MKLYDYVLSPSCYKVRLLASLLGVTLEVVAVNFHPGREHKGAALRMLNPSGSLPILTDGSLVLTESSAMLSYLAACHEPEWLGQDDPAMQGRVQQWLGFSHRLTASLGLARLIEMLLYPGDLNAAQHLGTKALRELEAAVFERRLRGQSFLAADRVTIADIACFPYVALAPDGSVSLDPYPNIRAWMWDIRGLPGFVEMPGIHRRHDLNPQPKETT